MTNQLLITLDGIRDDSSGLAWHELRSLDEVVDKVSSVLVMYVGHHSEDQGFPEESTVWIDRPRLLELRRTTPGCLSARWTLGPLPDTRPGIGADGARAVEALLKSSSGRGESSDESVQDCFDEISRALPKGVLLWLGDSNEPNRISIEHNEGATSDVRSRDEALISDLHEIGLRSAALLGPGPSAADHGDLLYDERGLPK